MDGQSDAEQRQELRNKLREPLVLFDRIEEMNDARDRAAEVARFSMLANGEIG